MRDQLEEPFEFRVHTQGGSAFSRRPQDSFRVGALVLALGVATLCAVFWPSSPRKSTSNPNEQTIASTSESTEENLASEVVVAPRGSVEDIIFNDRRSEFDVSELELADASLVDEENVGTTESFDFDALPVAQNPVASTSYEERQESVPTVAETPVKTEPDYEFEEDETAHDESKAEAPVVEDEQKQIVNTNANKRTSKTSSTPAYFARAANLPGRHNSFSLRNFARATNLVDPDDAYSPRSLTKAAQVDKLESEAR